ncbi:MAG: ATP-binding protein [Thermoanaerobaculia bacterium]
MQPSLESISGAAPATGRVLARHLSRDRWVQLTLAVWVVLALPYLVPIYTAPGLSAHSEFWIDLILIPVAVLCCLVGLPVLRAVAERRFWLLVACSLIAMWLAGFAYWTPRGQTLPFILSDVLYLVFYLSLGLAALQAPHRERSARPHTGLGALGIVVGLLGLLTYFVLIPGTLDAERYTTWLPSMYLFQILDICLVVFFLRLFHDAKDSSWRAQHGLLLTTVLLWTALDLVEALGWSGVFTFEAPGPLDLLWTLPLATLALAARSRHAPLDVGPATRSGRLAEATEPVVSHVALLATVTFPLIHFGFGFAGLLNPDLTRAREIVVVASVISLGTIAFVERALTLRRRRREAARRGTVESALRESEDRYRTLVENAPDAIVIFDAETGRFVDSNERALEMFRVSREQLLQLGPAELSPAVQPDGSRSTDSAREQIRRALGGEVPSFEWVHCDSEGKSIHCQVHLVALPAEGRKLIRGSMVDITDTLQLRDQLRQSRRMESIGRLAGGVAHDFNNLLTVITGFSELALQDPETEPEMQQRLIEIKKAGDRAASLTRQLLAFGRRQEMALQALDLNHAVVEVEALLRRLIGEDLRLELSLDPEVPPIQADPAQVEQVIVNLAANARDAMPRGGVLTIETSQTDLAAPLVHDGAVIPAGAYGRLAIRDDGVGMDEATRRRVFEPFFTTKGRGEGTGLGLATVYGIVVQSQGYLVVDSAPGEGSTFAVHFPVATEAPRGRPADDRVESPDGHESVLFVEDDEAVRSLHATGLKALGYSVLAARDGDHALSLVEQDNYSIEVLVTDVVLPGLSGPELADGVLSIRPEVKVIFISGYTDDLIRRKGKLTRNAPLLQKPFSPIDLAREIRRIVDAA